MEFAAYLVAHITAFLRKRHMLYMNNILTRSMRVQGLLYKHRRCSLIRFLFLFFISLYNPKLRLTNGSFMSLLGRVSVSVVVCYQQGCYSSLDIHPGSTKPLLCNTQSTSIYVIKTIK